MMDRGYNRDTQQCHMKVKELRQAYQKTKDANGCSRSEPHTCCFYDELNAILGIPPTITAPLSVDTCKGGVSRNREEDFVDEEEEEEEVEDSAQQASKESLIPGSQELFITLEPIPSQTSQGGLLDHEAGEGTSAANVSMLPLSSPSQRLAQSRRRKKCTRDEMFSELMQSSRTERAPQNAWRQTMAETRKALNERDERREEHDERRQDAMLSLMGEQTDMLRHLVELQERQQEHTPLLQPLYNRLSSSPSSITSSSRCPRTPGGGRLRAPSHSTPEDCPSNRRLAFNKF
ncbi:uncharacterized protein LOC141996018 [Natator depressus]|uniref:uncharacterized protein LOC141996018 n=1 Tax=Natator depressus TaxID=27790 RepID=UPI003EBC1ABA